MKDNFKNNFFCVFFVCGTFHNIFKLGTPVVYFDQRTHACACVRMVENDQNHCKMSEKVPFSSCVREAYERLTNKNEEKSFFW